MGANLIDNLGEISLRRREEELFHVRAATNPNWGAEPSHGSQIIGSQERLRTPSTKLALYIIGPSREQNGGPPPRVASISSDLTPHCCHCYSESAERS